MSLVRCPLCFEQMEVFKFIEHMATKHPDFDRGWHGQAQKALTESDQDDVEIVIRSERKDK